MPRDHSTANPYALSQGAKDDIYNRLRIQFGGPSGWFKVLELDSGGASSFMGPVSRPVVADGTSVRDAESIGVRPRDLQSPDV